MKKILVLIFCCMFLIGCNNSKLPLVSIGTDSNLIVVENGIEIKLNSINEIPFIKTWRGLADFPNDNMNFIKVDISIKTDKCIDYDKLLLKIDNTKYYKIINPNRIDGKSLEKICEDGNYELYFEIFKNYINTELIYINEDFISII